MNLTAKIKRLLKRKLATAMLITASVAAFATLGDGGKKEQSTIFKSGKTNAKSFSLRSTHNYRGNHLFSTNKSKFITLNTTVTVQKGNSTYIVPLKKKVLLEKIRFNPAQNRY